MDPWIDRKFLKRKFCHQLFLSLHDWYWWLYGRKWPIPPLLKRKLWSPIQKLENTKERFSPPCTMENNDANGDYHKFVRVGHQEWEIVEITIGITFFLVSLRFVFIIFYTGSFHVPPIKKLPTPKVSIATQNPNLM